jgi:ParB/RepB/Spo0J family partition protein
MTTVSAGDGIRTISLADIKVSTTVSQAERRARFDKAALAELTKSVKQHGVLVPVIVRFASRIDVVESMAGGRWYAAHKKAAAEGHNYVGTGHDTREAAEVEADALRKKVGYQLVAGERRYLAAKSAGVVAINADVRTLTDEQVLEIQLIENLQREGLHELAEAEGYEALLGLGHSAEEIADKVGKSKGYIYNRMKLLALSKAARTAFYDGKLTASTALLLARIPVEGLQAEALKEITSKRYGDEVMSFREAADLVRRDYMTNLSDAGFPTEDALLVAAAGPCGACPKRTGNQAELFGDVKSGNVCTDPICFKAKRQAHAERAIAQAKENGQAVITGKDAKKIMPWSGQVSNGYVELTDKCYDDKKNRTYGQLLGKDFQPTLVQDPESGILVKVVPPAAVKEALKSAGVQARTGGSNPQSAAEKKAKLEKRFRAALYSEMRDKFPAELGQGDLKTIALRYYDEMQQEAQKQILGLWQWEPLKRKGGYGLDYHKPAADGISGFDDAQITRFFFDLVFIKDLQVHTWSSDKPTLLLSTAKKLGVDPERIRKQLNAAAIPKAKKAAGRKK